MTKYLKRGLFLGMAVLLLFPVYSMADMKFTVMTPEGYSVTSSRAIIKNFFTTTDGVVAIVNGGISFAAATDIGLQRSGADIGNTIEVTVNTPVSFAVVSDKTDATIDAPAVPCTGCWTSPNFNWTPTAIGNYLAVFTATVSGGSPSTMIVLIKVNPPGFNLTINQSANGTISAPKTTGFPSSPPYESVQVTATPASGYRLASWSGDLSGTTSPATLLMDRDKTVSATFELIPPNQYALTASPNPAVGGSVTGTGSYLAGATVTLTATPNAGYSFTGWSGWSGYSGPATGSTAAFTMPANAVSVTANFSSGTGSYTDLVNSAIKVNTLNALGDFSVMGHSIARGSTTYFLIDPKITAGYTFNPLVIKLSVVVEDLGLNMVITSGFGIEVIELTSNNDKVISYPQPVVTGGISRVNPKYDLARYNAGNRFLVRITEPGQGSTTINVKWR